MEIKEFKMKKISINRNEKLHFSFDDLNIPCLIGGVSLIFDHDDIDYIFESFGKLKNFITDETKLYFYAYIDTPDNDEKNFKETSERFIFKGNEILDFFKNNCFVVE